MPEKHLFEYAIIRVVPCVEREEFMNVGVILFCSDEKFLKTKFKLNKERLVALSPELDLEELEERLNAFKLICAGQKVGGKIGEMPLSARFRWLTSIRSTVIQLSPVHPGLCENAKDTLHKLFSRVVV